MKTYLLNIMMIMLAAATFAQAPNHISYQAVVRKNDGSLVSLAKVGFKFSIHQNTAAGALVYEEVQNVGTNKDGLATLRIGAGTTTLGNFSSIDWSTGLYFVKTRIDVTGGSNYVLSNVSQFSAVPYVYFADKAKTMNYTSVQNAPKIDSMLNVLSEIKKANDALQQKIDSLALANKAAHFVGEHFGGGVVFYVYDNGKHGLIAAKSDLGSAVRWFGGSNTNTGATISLVGGGLQNTQLIVNNQIAVDGKPFAALNCLDYADNTDGVFISDWYLPSKDELMLMYNQRFKIGGFTMDSFTTTPNYWSSTESSSSTAFSQSFEDGTVTSEAKLVFFKVRPIRSF